MTVSPTRTAPAVTIRVLTPAQAQLAARRLVHELECVGAEPGAELGAAGVRFGAHLDDGLADGEARSGREVLETEVEIDVELVTG